MICINSTTEVTWFESNLKKRDNRICDWLKIQVLEVFGLKLI